MATRNIYKMLLKNQEYSFDIKQVTKLIIIIKKSKNEILISKSKEELFVSLSKIVVKSISNFFNLIKEIKKEKILHTREDICSECFIIMNKCVQNSDIKEIKKFYFYLNTSLNRGIYRVYEKSYKKHFPVLDSSDKTEDIILNREFVHNFDEVSIDIRNFSEMEIEIIKFKISGQKLKFFLLKNKISSSQYYLVFEEIVRKLKELYFEDDSLKKYFKN